MICSSYAEKSCTSSKNRKRKTVPVKPGARGKFMPALSVNHWKKFWNGCQNGSRSDFTSAATLRTKVRASSISGIPPVDELSVFVMKTRITRAATYRRHVVGRQQCFPSCNRIAALSEPRERNLNNEKEQLLCLKPNGS